MNRDDYYEVVRFTEAAHNLAEALPGFTHTVFYLESLDLSPVEKTLITKASRSLQAEDYTPFLDKSPSNLMNSVINIAWKYAVRGEGL